MASGGMDWAYRMLAHHRLDALGAAVILHLGWRDHPRFRTDRAIAGALGFDRSSVRRATAKLEQMGLIQRAPIGCWIACEVVQIVLGEAGPPGIDEPDLVVVKAGAVSPRGLQAPGGAKPPARGGVKPPLEGASSPRPSLRIEKRENAGGVRPGFDLARASSSAAAGLDWLDPSGTWRGADEFALFEASLDAENGRALKGQGHG